MRELFDKKIPDWREDNLGLRYAINIDLNDIWQAHQLAKRHLIEYVNKVCNAGLDQGIVTLGFARRATTYKRNTLIFNDIDRLRTIAMHCGPLQIIFAGKAHPKDNQGKELIREIFRIKNTLNDDIQIAYVPDYDMEIGRLMTSGVDLWLNTPLPPMEASGTSGMKAAINGVPSLSILDGWWIEGCIEGMTGWAIGSLDPEEDSDAKCAESLYYKLEREVIPAFYYDRRSWVEMMRLCIAINGSFFNTHRMVHQYIVSSYAQ